jgi:hypothetical protein
MTNVALIENKLPKELREQAKTFSIPDKFLGEKPEIIVMILESKSMDTNEEKQSWFNLLPIMNDEQYKKLVDILDREKQKLGEIEKKYEEKKQNIEEGVGDKLDYVKYQNKMNQIKQKENEEDKAEDLEAENLLNQI